MRNGVRLLGEVAALALLLGATGAGNASVPPAAAPAPTVSTEPDPASVLRWCGQEQVGTHRVARELDHRSRGLDERTRTLAARESDLLAAEKRLDERLTALTELRGSLSKLLDQTDASRNDKLAALVKMVEANRAASIAPMFQELDAELAVGVLDRMNRKKAGQLLGELPAPVAAGLAGRMTDPVRAEIP